MEFFICQEKINICSIVNLKKLCYNTNIKTPAEETSMADKKAEKSPATMKMGDERKKALEIALGKIEKDFGKGIIMKRLYQEIRDLFR